ncbi:hypothetical protein BST91_01335 [Nonlabens tegetincola]|uniref:hypothetical protein n=1 Tax=Nonlabens tegetincola TaxID=323273 RepID=UPI000A206AD9|nr:hypothetical protein [Nonlabens tegetincola]ARN70390.1 hypothetical protein BST91_01335 [Nonlabens tegetincola]
MLSDVFDSIKDKLSNYLSIQFKSIVTNNVIRHSNTFDYYKINESIFLIDGIKDENSNEHLESIKEEIETHIPNSKLNYLKKRTKWVIMLS